MTSSENNEQPLEEHFNFDLNRSSSSSEIDLSPYDSSYLTNYAKAHIELKYQKDEIATAELKQMFDFKYDLYKTRLT